MFSEFRHLPAISVVFSLGCFVPAQKQHINNRRDRRDRTTPRERRKGAAPWRRMPAPWTWRWTGSSQGKSRREKTVEVAIPEGLKSSLGSLRVRAPWDPLNHPLRGKGVGSRGKTCCRTTAVARFPSELCILPSGLAHILAHLLEEHCTSR